MTGNSGRYLAQSSQGGRQEQQGQQYTQYSTYTHPQQSAYDHPSNTIPPEGSKFQRHDPFSSQQFETDSSLSYPSPSAQCDPNAFSYGQQGVMTFNPTGATGFFTPQQQFPMNMSIAHEPVVSYSRYSRPQHDSYANQYPHAEDTAPFLRPGQQANTQAGQSQAFGVQQRASILGTDASVPLSPSYGEQIGVANPGLASPSQFSYTESSSNFVSPAMSHGYPDTDATSTRSWETIKADPNHHGASHARYKGQKKRARLEPGQERERRYACHMFKRYPAQFPGACSSFGFENWGRLKEHLLRSHESEIPGPQRNALPDIGTEGRKKDLEKWYRCWDTLYPNHPRPHTPYQGLMTDFEDVRRDVAVLMPKHLQRRLSERGYSDTGEMSSIARDALRDTYAEYARINELPLHQDYEAHAYELSQQVQEAPELGDEDVSEQCPAAMEQQYMPSASATFPLTESQAGSSGMGVDQELVSDSRRRRGRGNRTRR
ncbi:hypothetical protein MKZ38_010122 [Zalerion maritima]|uniref:Uncharacterized protein n=1 Tax=Zalerion maritima TaxID=339359 RepID=A0AAD5RST1_9PEZI|nr:hypothetical protein MKZ38_010122 [Zalerion maritima]